MDDTEGRVGRAHRLIDAEPAMVGAPDGMVGRLHRLCSALVRDVSASGVGVSLLTEDHSGGGMAAASDYPSRALEELQFTLTEGPCIDAFTSRRPVLEPDLAGRGMTRWPVYAPAAHEQGVRAVFAFPLQVGASRLGTLDLYRDQRGPLSASDVSQAVTFADVAVRVLLDGQRDAAHGQPTDGLDDVLAGRAEVYQAQGMTMVDLDVTLDEAMARLRAYAFAQNRSLSDVAHDIIAGRLRLHRDPSAEMSMRHGEPPAEPRSGS